MKWWGPNLRALSRHDPALAQALDAGGPIERPDVELLRGPKGAWTAKRLGVDGRRCLVHGQMDPLETHLRGLEKALPPAWASQAPDHGVCAVLGVGLGWPALAAAGRLPQALTLLLADPDLSLFSQGMARLDLGALWDRQRLCLCFGEAPAGIHQRAVDEGLVLSLTDSVLDAFDGGRAWALAWVRGFQGLQMTAAPGGQGLPDWLGTLVQARQRGERL